MMKVNELSRRRFLQLAVMTTSGAWLAACMPAAPAGTASEQGGASAEVPQVTVFMSLDPGELEAITALIDGYNKEHPESVVHMEVQPWDGYAEKLVTTTAGGTGPDLSTMHPLWVPFLADQEVALPLADLVAASPEFHEEDFFPQVAAYFAYKGNQYAYPYTSWPSVTYYNKTLFDKLGVPTPSEFQEGFAEGTDKWNWDQLLELATQTTTGEGPEKTFGLSPGYGAVPSSLTHLCQIVFSWGGEMWNEEYTESRLNEPEPIAAIKTQAALITEHHVVPLPVETEGIPDGVNSGRYAMWCWNRSEVPGFKNVDFELGMAPYPRGPVDRVLRDGPSGMMVNRHSKVTDPAWAFTKWFIGPEPGVLGGQVYQFEIQHAQPTRQSLFDNAVFVDNLLPWESRDIYADAGGRIRAMAPPPRFQEIDNVWREQWERITLGEVSVEEAVETFVAKANTMLQEPV